MTGRRQGWIALAFLLPNLLGFGLFLFGPVFFSLGAAFTNWNLVRSVPLHFVGLDNFTAMFSDTQFWQFFINTVYFMLGMPVSVAGSLALALLLNRGLRGAVAYRTVLYLPSFTAGVALFILWKALYNPEFGPINHAIEFAAAALGFEGVRGPRWLVSTDNLLGLGVEELRLTAAQFGLGARDAIVIMGIWTTVGGANMLLYVAGLANIPKTLYEAAAIDGAGPWMRFRHVTWPQLAPTTFFIVVMSTIAGFQGGFEQARVMTEGGPAGTTTTLAYYIYTKAFLEFQMGYSSAVAWVLFSIIFGFTLLNWRYGSQSADG